MKRLISLLLSFVLVTNSLAEEARILITADKLKRIPSLNLVVASGNVEISYRGMKLDADTVRLNEKTKDVVAEGNVVLWEEKGFLKCRRLEFNLNTKEGVAYRAKGFFRPYYYFSGEKITRLSGDIYNIKRGSLTTCNATCGKTPDWSFRGDRIIVKEGGFAKIYNLTGWVKRVPVFYSPFFMFPVSKERKTGFLFPTFGYKSDYGMFVEVPFYWAISRDKDATFWFTPYTDGSYKLGAEYRQRFSKDEKLYIYGDLLTRSQGKGNKWKLKGDAFKRLPYGAEFTGKVDIVSTSKYKKEFSDTFKAYTERHNDSYGIVVKSFDNMRFSVLGRYQDDVEEGYEEKVYKLPEVDWELYPVRLFNTPFYLETKAQYLRYRNKDDSAGYDFKLSRFDLYPKLSLPIQPAPWFSVVPKYGLRYTTWSKSLNHKGDEKNNPTSRLIYTFEVDAKGPLLYKYFSFGNYTVRHDIIPEVKYRYVPDELKDQRDIIGFDEVDRVDPENKVTYSLTNRFFSISESRQLLELKFEQSYDILKDRRGQPYKFSDMMFEVNAYPSRDVSLRYRLYQSVYGFGVTRWSFSGYARHKIKGFLPSIGITYYYEKFSHNRFIEYKPAIRYKNVELSFVARRDIYNNYWVERSWNLSVKGKCWALVVGYRTLDNRMSSSKNDKMITFFVVLKGLWKLGLGG